MNRRTGLALLVELFARFLLFFEYLLTGGIHFAAGLACYAVLLWLFLTEYFLAERLPWWQGLWELFFVLPALGLPAILAVYGVYRLERIRPAMSLMTFDARDQGKMAAPIAAWISMLREAARNRRGLLLGSFLRWEARLLARYGANRNPLPFSKLPGVWRRSFRHHLAWFPALLAYLCTPFSSAPMETFATILSDKPPGIGRIKVSRMDAKVGLIEEELLRRVDNEFDIQSPARFPQGWLTIFASDFPRVYRRIRTVCGGVTPGCLVARDAHAAGGIVAVKPLHAGASSVDFVRTAAGSLDLQMGLTVLQRDGVTIVAEGFVH